MKKFTPSQKYEILDSIDLRKDTISIDPDSATSFETIDNLNLLSNKVKLGDMNFTDDERVWIWEELEWKVEMTQGAIENPEIGFKAQAELNSLINAINKIK
jgi:hypothetical protein